MSDVAIYEKMKDSKEQWQSFAVREFGERDI